MGISYEIATDMAQVWLEAGFSLKSLRDKMSNVRNEKEEESVVEQLRSIIKRKEPTYPAR